MLALLFVLASQFDEGSGFGRDVVRLADLDGDGRAEFAVLDHRAPGEHPRADDVWIVSGRTLTAFRKLEIPCERDDALPIVACTDDWNSDGTLDVVARGSVRFGIILRVWDGRTGARIVERTFDARGLSGAIAQIGDVDGDCVPDLALGEVRSDTYVAASPPSKDGVRFVSGRTGDVLRDDQRAGSDETWSSFPDLDGDGHADFVVCARSGGRREPVSLGGSVMVADSRGTPTFTCALSRGRRVVRLHATSPADERLALGLPSAFIGSGGVEILALSDGRLAGRVSIDDEEDLWHVGSALAVLEDVDADGVEDLAIATDQELSHLPGAVVVASGRSGRTLAMLRRRAGELVVVR